MVENFTKTVAPDAQKALSDDLRAALLKHDLTPLEMLGVASHFVGVVAALQDPEKIKAEEVMAVIQFNLELGNADALKQLEAEEGVL
jgi:hypothetical protein